MPRFKGKPGIYKAPPQRVTPEIPRGVAAPAQVIHAVPQAPEPVTEAAHPEPLHIRAQALMKLLERSNRTLEAGFVGDILVKLGEARARAMAAVDLTGCDEVKALMQEILDL